ncbi:MAG: hypothetical protein R3C02_11270 [Planctomycetaceae bacterium]
MGLGDLFSVRIAGNIVSARSARQHGVRLCPGWIKAHARGRSHSRSCDFDSSTLASEGKSARDATGCEHLDAIVRSITPSIDETTLRDFPGASIEQESLVDQVARNNVLGTIDAFANTAQCPRELSKHRAKSRSWVAMYNVSTGEVEVITQAPLVGAAKA